MASNFATSASAFSVVISLRLPFKTSYYSIHDRIYKHWNATFCMEKGEKESAFSSCIAAMRNIDAKFSKNNFFWRFAFKRADRDRIGSVGTHTQWIDLIAK